MWEVDAGEHLSPEPHKVGHSLQAPGLQGVDVGVSTGLDNVTVPAGPGYPNNVAVLILAPCRIDGEEKEFVVGEDGKVVAAAAQVSQGPGVGTGGLKHNRNHLRGRQLML